MKKADIEKLTGLPDADKANLFSLLDSIEEKDKQIATLRTKADDSDKVVARNADLEKLIKDREKQNSDLQAQLEGALKKPAGTLDGVDLFAFRPLLDIFSGENDDETSND